MILSSLSEIQQPILYPPQRRKERRENGLYPAISIPVSDHAIFKWPDIRLLYPFAFFLPAGPGPDRGRGRQGRLCGECIILIQRHTPSKTFFLPRDKASTHHPTVQGFSLGQKVRNSGRDLNLEARITVRLVASESRPFLPDGSEPLWETFPSGGFERGHPSPIDNQGGDPLRVLSSRHSQ